MEIRRIIQKTIISCICFIILISLSACTSGSPDKTVSNFFEAVKKSDLAAANQYLSSENENFTYDDEQQKKIVEGVLSKLEYQIISTQKGKDTIVKTKITSPDLVKIITAMMQDLMPQLFEMALNGDDKTDNGEKLIQQYFENSLADPSIPLTSSEVDIRLIYDTNKKNWLIQSDDNLINAMTGNASKAFMDMGDSSAEQVVETENEESAIKPDNIIHPMNQEASVGKAAITVMKAEKSQGDQFNKPKSGMEYIIITIKERNIATENFTLDYNPYFFKLKNSRGQITDSEITTIDNDTHLDTGKLVNNGEVTGTVVFEVPKDDNNLIFLFAPDGEPLLMYKLNVESPVQDHQPIETKKQEVSVQATQKSQNTKDENKVNGDAILGIWERYGDKYSGMQAQVKRDGKGYIAMTYKVTDEAEADGYSTSFTTWVEIKCIKTNTSYNAEEMVRTPNEDKTEFILDFVKVKITLSSDGKNLTVDGPNGTSKWKKI